VRAGSMRIIDFTDCGARPSSWQRDDCMVIHNSDFPTNLQWNSLTVVFVLVAE
jgi:hypothetical protein